MNPAASVDLSFFIPCYNEAPRVKPSLETIRLQMESRPLTFEVLVVDDGSQDGTSEAVKEFQAEHPDFPLELQRHSTNLGLGANYFLAAEKARGRYFMLINGDNSIQSEDLEGILDQYGKADMIIPYVVNQKDRQLHRIFISVGFNFLAGLVTGHHLKYYNGPVLHRRETILRHESKTSGFAYQAEILAAALDEGLSYVEVPLHYVKTHSGFSNAFRWTNVISVVQVLGRLLAHRLERLLTRG